MRRTLVAALILCVPAVVGCHSAAPAETSTPAEGGQASAAPPVARSGDWSGDQSDDTVDGGGGLELTVALEAPARVASTSRRHLGADTTLAGLVRIESATDFDAVPSLREIGDLPSGTVRRHGGDATTWVVDLPGDAPAHWLVALRTEILRQDADAEVYLRVHGGMTLGEALSAHPSPSTDASGGEIHVIGPLRPLPTHPLFRVDMHDGGRTVVDAPYREDGVDGRVELQLEGGLASALQRALLQRDGRRRRARRRRAGACEHAAKPTGAGHVARRDPRRAGARRRNESCDGRWFPESDPVSRLSAQR